MSKYSIDNKFIKKIIWSPAIRNSQGRIIHETEQPEDLGRIPTKIRPNKNQKANYKSYFTNTISSQTR